MNVLVYCYGSICEPYIDICFRKLGLNVVHEESQVWRKKVTALETVDTLAEMLRKDTYLFVFTINFFPAVSEICQVFNVPYICWTVDAPVMELFSPALSNPVNRIFLFDRSQYLRFKDRNPGHIFHLPLACSTEEWDKAIRNATPKSKAKYSADISFIGSLYNEKDPYSKISGMSDHARGYLEGLMEAQMQLWDSFFIGPLISDDIMEEMVRIIPDMHMKLCEDDPDARLYLMSHEFLASRMAVLERQRYLSALSEQFSLELYTLSDASALPKARLHPKGAETFTEMPVIFHESKINLNITLRSISTGLSQRVFDVCGCAGFLLCNWQEELPELYEPGLEVETFSSVEELLDKSAWYLEHEDERKKIALAAYERTKADHTYERRIAEMIKIVNSTL